MRSPWNTLLALGLLACGSSTAATDAGPADAPLDGVSDRPRADTRPATPDGPAEEPTPPPDVAPDTAPMFPCPLGLPGEYVFFRDGGNGSYRDRGTITPPRSMLFVRERGDTMATRCPSMLADCGTADVVDLAEVTAALVHPDVEAALSRRYMLYGVDTRPADGQVFVLLRGLYRLEVGSACRGVTPGCVPVPAGIQRAVDILQALLEQERTAPACRALLGSK